MYTTQLAKLSFNHSNGCTHSWRFSIFYKKFNPNPRKFILLWEKSGPNAIYFNLHFFFGLGWPWVVGEFVGFMTIFICFRTQHHLVHRKDPYTGVERSDRRRSEEEREIRERLSKRTMPCKGCRQRVRGMHIGEGGYQTAKRERRE